MKAESLLLSDVITHTSHSSIILLGLSVCVCVWGGDREGVYVYERARVHTRVGVLHTCEKEKKTRRRHEQNYE